MRPTPEFASGLALKTAGRRRGPEKMPMAALRLPRRTCVLSSSPRLALDIFQARLARSAQVEVLGPSLVCYLKNWRCRVRFENSGPETRAWENADGGVAATRRTCVLSSSPRLALDIFQARLARSAQVEVLGRNLVSWCAYCQGRGTWLFEEWLLSPYNGHLLK